MIASDTPALVQPELARALNEVSMVLAAIALYVRQDQSRPRIMAQAGAARYVASVARLLRGWRSRISVSSMGVKHSVCAIAFTVLAGCATHPAADQSFGHNILRSRAAPEIALRIDPAFHALPPIDVPIEDLTVARRFVFVDAAADHAVRRLIVVQFERVNAGSDFRFVYPSRPPHQFGAQTYRFGTYVYDDAHAADAAPDREAARTRALLIAHGLHAPRLFRTARLARVSDADGKSEIIIFYCENADADYPAGPLPGADEDGDLPLEGEARDALVARMQAAIRPVSG